jgi:uncharacterized protein
MGSNGSGLNPRAVRLINLLFAGGWPARAVARLGLQAPLRVHKHRVRVPSVGSRDRLRVAYISDLHAGPMTSPDFIVGVLEHLRRMRPDVLLLGGDFVEYDAQEIEWVAPLLGALPTVAGTYAVLGNHDCWADRSRIMHAIRKAGIRVLVNENARLPEPFENVWVCGLDDPVLGRPDSGPTFAGASGTRILLMHSPSGLSELGHHDFNLAVCGHTHGGQIALPGGVPIVLPRGRLCRKYGRGRFELDAGRTLLVSCGLGCSTLPFRLYADPEILDCEILASP